MELLTDNGFDGIANAKTIVLYSAMKMERSLYVQAAPYERHEHRQGHANDYKPKTVKTRVGHITLALPQTRGSGFFPGSLVRGSGSERALKVALAESCVQCISPRKAAEIIEETRGLDISSSEVSRDAADLDEQLEAWRNRALGAYPYVYLNAR